MSYHKSEKQAKLKELRGKLANLSPEQRQALIDRGLIATVEGRTLSLHNTLLVYLQCNSQAPSVVGGYKQWKAAERQVQKGQHGYVIWFPVGEKDKDTGDIISAERYLTGTVFDISQTEPIEAEPDSLLSGLAQSIANKTGKAIAIEPAGIHAEPAS